MSNTQQSQTFYSLTLEAPSAVQSCVTCNVIPGLKNQDQQIFEARGSRLYLHRIYESVDRSWVKISTVLEQDVFAIVRNVASWRIPGTSTDQLTIATDAGGIVLLQYDAEKNAFKQLSWYTYGKSGVRRTVPGQYLANDPRGRCCMFASVEKNKVVYILQRLAGGTLQLSSPHEANTWATLCFALCALDVGWDTPIFAALEVDYSEAEADPTGQMYESREKQLVYYSVDLGLNHVVKSWSDTVDYTANMLFGVPGGQDGPSGVLVCCEGRIYYRHDKSGPLSIPIPRRNGPTDDRNRKPIIVSGCLHLSRQRHEFFFLLQTDDGDVFKLTMEIERDAEGRLTSQPLGINLKYYETLPVAKNMLLIRKGYLYVAAENGSNKLYHVHDLAEDLSDEPENNFSSEGVSADPLETYTPTYFKPRGLKNLSLAVEPPSLHPLMRARVDNLTGEDAPQIYALQGTGNKSLFKTVRHGLEVEEVISTEIGNVPWDNLWSLRHRSNDEYHSYLLLSSDYGDNTMVLSIGDSVETMENTPFLTNRATVTAAQMGDATLVQVHARGVRSIMDTESINEWPSPAHRTIVAASANQYQLLLGLSSSELAFFFMGEDGVLNQLEEMPEMSGKITAISVGQTPKGQMQSKYAVVGCDDCTIRVLSIELDSPLESRSVQALSAVPTSLEIVEMTDPSSASTVTYVHIGLQSGLYLRAVIDATTGELGEVRTKFLGAKAARLFPVEVAEQEAILACSSRPWLGYNHPTSGTYTLSPLVTQQLEAARPFVSEELRCLCAVQGTKLMILSIKDIDGRLSSREIHLRYTPRAMSRHPESAIFYVVQSEGNTLPAVTKPNTVQPSGDQSNGDTDVERDEELERHIGLSKAMGQWASCVQAIDPLYTNAATYTAEMTENEAALCCTVVSFASRESEYYLAVGTGKDMTPGVQPSGAQPKGFVRLYKITSDGQQLEFVHKTPFNAPIYAVHPFQGRLAVGVADELFIYDIGMKSLLRKSRGTVVPNIITSLASQGNRIICGDVSDSVTYVVYKPDPANRMIAFADDVVQRWTTAMTMVDYETVAGGDKFGNLWLVRCPEQASKEADEEGIGGYIANERSYLGGTPYRLDLRAHFFTQDIPMSVQRTALVAGGQEVLFWSGLQGTLGMLVPFASRDDVEFFTQLEQHIRNEEPPLSRRDHLMYRSYYVPVKAVIDGDLCERFMRLGYDKKQKIAAEVDREVKEIERKVQEMRTRVAF